MRHYSYDISINLRSKERQETYDFFTAFQGHDRNFHRITGTYIRDRETINRR